MADTESRHSSGEYSANDLNSMFTRIRSKPQKMGGQDCFVISKRFLCSLEDSIHAKLEGQSSLSPTALINMNEELQNLRALKVKAEDATKAAKLELHANLKNIEEYRESVAAAERSNRETIAIYENQTKEILQAQENSKKEVEDYKAQINKAKHTSAFSPEEAKVLNDKLHSARDDVRSLGTERNHLQNEISKLNASFDTNARRLKALEDENALLKAKAYNVKELSEEDLQHDTPVSANDLVVENPLIKKILGEKGVQWFAKFEQQTRQDIRNQAYFLMLSTKSSKDQVVLGISKILETVYKWIKTTPFKTRLVVQKWLDIISEDVKSAKIKTYAFYRDTLRELISEHNIIIDGVTQKKKAKKDNLHPAAQAGSSKFTYEVNWFDHVSAWAQVLYNRGAKRPAKKIGNIFKEIWIGVKISWRAYRAFVDKMTGRDKHFAEDYKEVIYDAYEEPMAPQVTEIPKSESSASAGRRRLNKGKFKLFN